mgnify:CR=1 FL=1
MPELTWVGKEKVITHHLDVPYRVLERQYSFDRGGRHYEDNGSPNMVIYGDNLEALKALLPRYEGQIDCIYIDPPYNTGNEGWVYNDNVNDPRIRKWLGEVVGKEGDDLSRHDKWLCMMYPRLRLLQKLLSPDGVLVISLSYHELSNLLQVLNEIFSNRQIMTTIVQTSGGKPSNGFNITHEFLIFVTPKAFQPNATEFSGGKDRSPFEGLTLSTFDKVQRPNQVYPIFVDEQTLAIHSIGPSLQELIKSGQYVGDPSNFTYGPVRTPEGCVAVWPITVKGKECVWRLIPDRLKSDWESGFIKISRTGSRISVQYLPSGVIKKIRNGELEVLGTEDNAPTLIFGKNRTAGKQLPTVLDDKSFYTVKGTTELEGLFKAEGRVFDYPKPSALIRYVIGSVCKRDGIVLDSFAGSGTTAQAVLELNMQDGGKRRFILVELGDYAESVTAERINRVIQSSDADLDCLSEFGASYSFFELGEPLLREGLINEEVGIDRVREYIWFNETRSPFRRDSSDNPYFLGIHQRTAYHLLYERDKPTTLNRVYLAALPEEQRSDSLVVYADTCSLSAADMVSARVTFKKIPRDISRL